MSLFFDLFVQLVSDFRLQLSRLKWHRDSPRCLVTFAYDNMMHYTFLLAWVVSWKQLQYPSLRQVFQAPLSGNMAHGCTKEELWRAKGTIPVMTYDMTFREKGIQTTVQTLYQRLVGGVGDLLPLRSLKRWRKPEETGNTWKYHHWNHQMFHQMFPRLHHPIWSEYPKCCHGPWNDETRLFEAKPVKEAPPTLPFRTVYFVHLCAPAVLFLNGKNLGHPTCLQGLLCYTHEPNAGNGGRDPVECNSNGTNMFCHMSHLISKQKGFWLLDACCWSLVSWCCWLIVVHGCCRLFRALASECFVVAIVAVADIEWTIAELILDSPSTRSSLPSQSPRQKLQTPKLPAAQISLKHVHELVQEEKMLSAWVFACQMSLIPIGSMGLVYLPTFGWYLWYMYR